MTATETATVSESLSWKARLQGQLQRGLTMVKTGASKLAEGARWFARHLLMKVVCLILLASLLAGFIWLLVWAGMACLAVSPWLLVLAIVVTGWFDIAVIYGVLVAMVKVIVSDVL